MARDLLDDSSSESGSSSEGESIDLKVNEDYAKRFEHNKKREELQKLEEKHGQTSRKRKNRDEDGPISELEDESSSDSENEDDAGDLATVALDSEIMATLDAIRSKDPRVYDGKTTFYSEVDASELPVKETSQKAMYLRDYHRENLLNNAQKHEEGQPLTYNQEQEHLKNNIISEMHAAVDNSDEDDDLLVAVKREKASHNAVELDVENADKDPETFLSNFMSSRAWVPTEKSTWQPLQSDDEEEEARAEAYEEAYNMRFEDPNKSNETLRTHARDMAAKYSVRRDENNSRKRKRNMEKELKEVEKQQRKEEKARLRKLRIEEVENKVRKIKKAAGMRMNDIRPEDWVHFVDDEWDDAKWEEEMQQRFGDVYYAEEDAISSDETLSSDRKRKLKKPKFDDDIDINDIVPDFKEDEGDFSLTEDEQISKKKDYKKVQAEKKRDSKKERRIIELLVDDQLQLELDSTLPGQGTGFRYRETSPQSFGLSNRDILMADDSRLNEFAGLKKLATWRDPERKRKDKKHLGKKARLRQWRKETFGNENGLQEIDLLSTPGNQNNESDENEGTEVRTDIKKRRRRSKKQRTKTTHES